MQSVTRSPNYLSRNRYSYCFRIKIPIDLQRRINKKELRYSLKTGNLSSAKNKARYMAGRVQLLFRDMKKGQFGDMDITTAQIQRMIKRFMQELISNYDKPVLNRAYTIYDREGAAFSNQEGLEETVEFIDEIKADLNLKMHTGNYSVAESKADRLLAEEGFIDSDIEKASPEYAKLCRGVYRAMIKGCEYKQKKLSGQFSDELEDVLNDCVAGSPTAIEVFHSSPPTSEPNNKKAEENSITLGDLADAYEREKLGEWSKSSKSDWDTIRKVYFRFVDPTTQAKSITRRIFHDYRELLKSLPPRFISTKKYDGMTAADVKALELTPEETVSPATVNKHVSFLQGMFKHAVNLEYIPTNPASDMKVTDKSDARKKVDEFSTDDLALIYNCPELGQQHPYQFWLPILGLYTGARREELCSLYASDIKSEDGVWYIDINLDTPDKQIKTYQIRKVPIHPFVLELGFLEYVRGCDGRLWPELNNNNQSRKYGHYFGRYFNDRLIGPLGIKPTTEQRDAGAPNKTFHSYRHTLISWGIRARLDINVIKGMVGHKEGGVTFGTYFKGFTVRQIYDDVVSKIDHGIDLSHLKNSKWVVK